MQLDVDVSPPAIILSVWLTLTKGHNREDMQADDYELLSSNFGLVTDRQTDGRTESDAYEPTVQVAQVCSKMVKKIILLRNTDAHLHPRSFTVSHISIHVKIDNLKILMIHKF